MITLQEGVLSLQIAIMSKNITYNFPNCSWHVQCYFNLYNSHEIAAQKAQTRIDVF